MYIYIILYIYIYNGYEFGYVTNYNNDQDWINVLERWSDEFFETYPLVMSKISQSK
jgi:hypothetical protein